MASSTVILCFALLGAICLASAQPPFTQESNTPPKSLDDALKAAEFLYKLLKEEETANSVAQTMEDADEQFFWIWINIHIHKKLLLQVAQQDDTDDVDDYEDSDANGLAKKQHYYRSYGYHRYGYGKK